MKSRIQLTRREKEVISLMSQWKSREETAAALGIDYETVRTHLSNIRRKLNVNKTTKAIVMAMSEGLICT